NISHTRDDADTAEMHLNQDEQLFGQTPAVEDLFELKHRRARVETLKGHAPEAIGLAREALELIADGSRLDEGLAVASLADALALAQELEAADAAYTRAVELLEEAGRWRDATNACRGWARMLRRMGREDQALDVLDRAAGLAMRATPADTRVER
ncbi:MAG: hypothetical protein ABUS54_05355, partial [Actinomycetota bacterium]